MFSRNVRLFILGQFLVNLGMTFWSLLFNLYLEEAGFNKAAIGNTLAVGSLAAALFSLPAGFLVAYLDKRWLLIISELFTSVFAGLALTSLESPTLKSAVFMAFAFMTFSKVVAGPFIMSNTSKLERTYVFSVLFITALLAGVIGNLFAGHLKDLLHESGISVLLGYRYAIGVGVFLSLSGIAPYLFMDKTSSKEPRTGRLTMRLFVIKKMNWGLFTKALIPSIMISAGAGLIIQFINLYFKDTFKSQDTAIGLYLSLQSATMALGVMLAPLIAEKLGKVNTIVSTQLLSIPFMLLLAVTGRLDLAILAFLIRAALMNMSNPVYNTLLLEQCKPEEQGMLNALLQMTASLSWSIAAVVFGSLLHGNYKVSFYIAIVLYCLSSVLYYVFFRDADRVKLFANATINSQEI
jgi:MFS family permease